MYSMLSNRMYSRSRCMSHAVHWQALQAMFAVAALLLCMGSLVASTGPSLNEIFIYGDNPYYSANSSGTPWTYDLAGDDWSGDDGEGNPWICLTGQQQSPVNLPLVSSAATVIDTAHKSVWQLGAVIANGSNVGIVNNGHSVQVSWSDPAFAPCISIAVQEGQSLHSTLDLQNGNKAKLVKAVAQHFHFHVHSEHLVDGRIFPLEAHLVSIVQRSELPSCPPTGCIVVTAVMFELAQDLTEDNPWLAPLFDAMPYEEQEVRYLPAGTQLDLQRLLPSNTSYMAYSGSLTTPPCTEGVLWMVFLNTQAVSLKQWRNFMKAVGDYNCTLEASSNSTDTEPNPRVGLADYPLSSNTSNSTGADQPASPQATRNGSATQEATIFQQNSTQPDDLENNSSNGDRADNLNVMKPSAGAQLGTPMWNSTLPEQVNLTNPANKTADSSATGPPERLLMGIHSVKVASTGLRRHLAEVTGSNQRHVCTKLGAGSNYRLPQPLNGRALRIWKDVPVKKSSYLPEDAATAASAGAIAGIVLGVTLGAGLTAAFGYLGWKLYNNRRVDRMYKLGVNDNDMLMVQQEVERQWLTAAPSTATAASAGLARRSHGEIPL